MMFEKLNQLVRENIKTEIFLNGGLPSGVLDYATQEASGVIVDVLKSQLDNGKASDLMCFFEGKKAEEAENVVDRVQTSERLFAHEVSYFYKGFCFQILKLTVLLKKLSILKQICGQCLLTPDSSCKLFNLGLILIGHQWILCQL